MTPSRVALRPCPLCEGLQRRRTGLSAGPSAYVVGVTGGMATHIQWSFPDVQAGPRRVYADVYPRGWACGCPCDAVLLSDSLEERWTLAVSAGMQDGTVAAQLDESASLNALTSVA